MVILGIFVCLHSTDFDVASEYSNKLRLRLLEVHCVPIIIEESQR